jgi:hypothetical protein
LRERRILLDSIRIGVPVDGVVVFSRIYNYRISKAVFSSYISL